MREAQSELDRRDAQVLGVGPTADYQAQALLDDGMPYPLLLDPENRLREAAGAAERFSLRRSLHPSGAAAYWRAVRQAKNFSPIWSQLTERPVVLVLDERLDVTWSHVGQQIGDYPSLDEIFAALDAIEPTT